MKHPGRRREPRRERCAQCQQLFDACWRWYPTLGVFKLPGWHLAGWPAFFLCDDCRLHIEQMSQEEILRATAHLEGQRPHLPIHRELRSG